jgi:hypothetical protein
MIGMAVDVAFVEQYAMKDTFWIMAVGVIVVVSIFMFGKKFVTQTTGMKIYQCIVENVRPVE